MFDNKIKRIGFACKFIDNIHQIQEGIKEDDECRKYNAKTTTVSWLNKQSKEAAEERLWEIVKYNIRNLSNVIFKISSLDESLRMMRITSDLFPMYTHRDHFQFYKNSDVIKYISDNLNAIGRYARHTNVRLSFHPGQFCVLASDKSHVVDSSISEFEYHVDMAKWMGYCKTFQDFKINVHLSGQGGVEGFTRAFNRLSPEARSCITIENDECSCSVDDCLQISDLCPVVLDIHHQWIKTEEYIQSNDDRCKKVLDSWRGQRPVIHYSISSEHTQVDKNILPDISALLKSHSKQKLRAHSDLYWNEACNNWGLSFLEDFDIMCESKGKNLSSFELYNVYKNKGKK